MSPALYASLKADIAVVAKHYEYDVKTLDMQDMQTLFSRVQFQRMNNDEHPVFQRHPQVRCLPCWGGEANQKWLDQFYRTEGLSDGHITTALRKIKMELQLEEKKECIL